MSSGSIERAIRWRLLSALAALWLSASALAALALWHETGEVLDSALTETAQRLLVMPMPHSSEDDEVLVAEVGEHEEYVIYQLFDTRGRLRLRSHQAPDSPLAAGLADGMHEAAGRRLAVVTRDDGRRRAVVAEPVSHRYATLRSSVLALVLPLLLLLPIAAALLSLALRRGLAPLRALGAELDAREPHQLSPLKLIDASSELEPVRRSINALLERVGRLLQAEQAFAAQAAHELRTPLAAARAQAQRLGALLHAGSAEAEKLARLQSQLDRLERLALRLLDSARVRGTGSLRREPLDLVALAKLCAAELGTQAEPVHLELHAAHAPIEGDPDMILIALRNLIDNARRHGRPPVSLHVTERSIGVRDQGTGIDPDDLQRLTQPFVRDGAPDAGHGLGLSLVAEIARAHGAALGATQLGSESEVQLVWPPA
jgi:two-component system OmpR family sensor kinase